MFDFILNKSISVEKIPHEDPEICVYVIDDFIENPSQLIDYARNKAYFGRVGDDKTAYPGIRDRLPTAYEDILNESRDIPEFETNDEIFCTIFGVDVYEKDGELKSEFEYAKTL